MVCRDVTVMAILTLDWRDLGNKEKKCHDKKAGQRRAWCVE